MDSCDLFIHILRGCFIDTGQWVNDDFFTTRQYLINNLNTVLLFRRGLAKKNAYFTYHVLAGDYEGMNQYLLPTSIHTRCSKYIEASYILTTF